MVVRRASRDAQAVVDRTENARALRNGITGRVVRRIAFQDRAIALAAQGRDVGCDGCGRDPGSGLAKRLVVVHAGGTASHGDLARDLHLALREAGQQREPFSRALDQPVGRAGGIGRAIFHLRVRQGGAGGGDDGLARRRIGDVALDRHGVGIAYGSQAIVRDRRRDHVRSLDAIVLNQIGIGFGRCGRAGEARATGGQRDRAARERLGARDRGGGVCGEAIGRARGNACAIVRLQPGRNGVPDRLARRLVRYVAFEAQHIALTRGGEGVVVGRGGGDRDARPARGRQTLVGVHISCRAGERDTLAADLGRTAREIRQPLGDAGDALGQIVGRTGGDGETVLDPCVRQPLGEGGADRLARLAVGREAGEAHRASVILDTGAVFVHGGRNEGDGVPAGGLGPLRDVLEGGAVAGRTGDGRRAAVEGDAALRQVGQHAHGLGHPGVEIRRRTGGNGQTVRDGRAGHGLRHGFRQGADGVEARREALQTHRFALAHERRAIGGDGWRPNLVGGDPRARALTPRDEVGDGLERPVAPCRAGKRQRAVGEANTPLFQARGDGERGRHPLGPSVRYPLGDRQLADDLAARQRGTGLLQDGVATLQARRVAGKTHPTVLDHRAELVGVGTRRVHPGAPQDKAGGQAFQRRAKGLEVLARTGLAGDVEPVGVDAHATARQARQEPQRGCGSRAVALRCAGGNPHVVHHARVRQSLTDEPGETGAFLDRWRMAGKAYIRAVILGCQRVILDSGSHDVVRIEGEAGGQVALEGTDDALVVARRACGAGGAQRVADHAHLTCFEPPCHSERGDGAAAIGIRRTAGNEQPALDGAALCRAARDPLDLARGLDAGRVTRQLNAVRATNDTEHVGVDSGGGDGAVADGDARREPGGGVGTRDVGRLRRDGRSLDVDRVARKRRRARAQAGGGGQHGIRAGGEVVGGAACDAQGVVDARVGSQRRGLRLDTGALFGARCVALEAHGRAVTRDGEGIGIDQRRLDGGRSKRDPCGERAGESLVDGIERLVVRRRAGNGQIVAFEREAAALQPSDLGQAEGGSLAVAFRRAPGELEFVDHLGIRQRVLRGGKEGVSRLDRRGVSGQRQAVAVARGGKAIGVGQRQQRGGDGDGAHAVARRSLDRSGVQTLVRRDPGDGGVATVHLDLGPAEAGAGEPRLGPGR